MKKLPDIQHIHVFIHVVKNSSFIKAAKELSLSPPAVTNTINMLEANLGIRLLNRSTRSVSLTPEGEILFHAVQSIYNDYLQAIDQLNFYQDHPQGKIRISIPRIVQDLFFSQIFLPFKQQYPDIQLEVLVSDQIMNIVDEGIDFGVRFYEQIPQDMIAIALDKPVALYPFATPEFIEKYGQPKDINDLSRFNCIQRKFPSGAFYAWEFIVDQKRVEKKVKGDLIFNTDHMMIQAGLQHLGIIYVYENLVQSYVEQQKLQRILPEYECPKAPFYLYYSSKKYISTTLKVFIEWIKQSQYKQINVAIDVD